MRVVLEVQSGPQAGRTVALQSGEELRIGRGLDAQVAFPEDTFMSSVHCVLQCGVKMLSIRDSESTNGIRVNGVAVQSSALKNGDEIVVGRTHFLVYVREDQRAHRIDDSSLNGRSLVSVLREEFQPLWAILDAARDKKILTLLKNSGVECQSLYEGARGQALAGVAPYLVRLPADSSLIQTLAKDGCGKSWGVFLTCNVSLKELRKHLRHFLTVKLPEGERAFFRYYDPRVLRVFLPTCNESDSSEFFGAVQNFLVEDETPGEFLRFWLNGRAIATAKLTLKQAESAPVSATQ